MSPHEKRVLNPGESNPQLSYAYNTGSHYEGVLNLTAALDALIPENDVLHPEQPFFQVTHLVTEYSWAHVHYELRRVIKHLDESRYTAAARLIDRSTEVSRMGNMGVKLLLEHLPQHSLLTMRNTLPQDATGLDSPGYRNLRRIAKVLWKQFETAMLRESVDLAGLIQLQNDTAGGEPASSQVEALALVREALLRLDACMMEWKQTHLRMVWSQLGGLPSLRAGESGARTEDETLPVSLGGRPISGVQHRSDKALFPALWSAAEDAYHRLSV
ncbi:MULTISPECIES: hypothetical protein [unclassified Crossiella]|uniref:hypothetical protein n=1 Tax=unclassified Crossiella TaxID=2620835 RepID=UPI0020001388|nr:MULTISPECIES: hypothetical protein [unclassified Crossiella]MCK2244139.1 hypothetical protein [Crossiella sp. S99.2]MCK2257943.1 hypothetical protein [Crossiella sp. S99.1]